MSLVAATAGLISDQDEFRMSGSASSRACPICDAVARNEYARRIFAWGEFEQRYTFFRCHECHSVFCANPPDAAYLKRFYEEKASIKLAGDRAPPAIYHEILRILDALQPAHSDILDIGCGDGTFLAMARDAGFSGLGIDSAAQNIQACKARGIDALCESFPTQNLAGRTFNIIVAIQVLEHLPDPQAFFASCAELLRPGGVLILQTPNARCFSFRMMRGHHRYFIPPEHLCLWSKRGFKEAARKASLDVVKIEEVEGDHQFRELLAWLLKLKFLRTARWNISLSGVASHHLLKQISPVLLSSFGAHFERLGANQILCVLRRNSTSSSQPQPIATRN